MTYATIEDHIESDAKIISDPQTSPQARRHFVGELHELEVYHTNHPEDHHDPNCLELFCEINPHEPECRVYDD